MLSRLHQLATCAALMMLLAGCAHHAQRALESGQRRALDFQTLLQGKDIRESSMAAFAPPAGAMPPTARFEGRLTLSGAPHTRTLVADADFLSPRQMQAALSFPTFHLQFVQDGSVLLPAQRGYINTPHPYWDIVIEPGRVWSEAGDHGFTRAAVPFALVQKNMNCTHYGVLTFLYRADGTTSQAAMQISSETCRYLQFDMWGLLQADYSPHEVTETDARIAAYRANQARRLPTRPITSLATDYPGVDPSALAIGPDNARSLYGLVVGDTHYVSACPTRRGNYPFCDVLPLPSYSTAKSAVAALALMAVSQQHPNAASLRVADFAPNPACRSTDWAQVSFRHLLDMTTGHYDSTAYLADEDAVKSGQFFVAASEADKAAFACTAYPRKSAPGESWVYHTSDTFLLGEGLRRYLRSLPDQTQADVFQDIVVGKIYAPLGLSATARSSRRTMDSARQAFFGYGLQLHRDDLARLAAFIARADGRINGAQVLDPDLLHQALQKEHDQRGSVVTSFPDFRYQLGFWARNVGEEAGCEDAVWVPFMSGFGGLSVVLYPGGTIFYNISDSGTADAFDWSPSIQEVRHIENFCPSA